jgi:xanthine dehydrogenase accessory factor
MRKPVEVFDALAQAAVIAEPVALAILSEVQGSSPQTIGSKAVFYPDGRLKGTVGGGCLESEIQRRAVRALQTGKPENFELVLDHDFGWDDGLICGGTVRGLIVPNAQSAGAAFWRGLSERRGSLDWGIGPGYRVALVKDWPGVEWLYRETVQPPCALWIAGAGHIARAVAPLAAGVDFAVTVLDDRPALACDRWFPGAEVRAATWEQLLALPLPKEPAFGLVVTRGHRHDALVLRHWIHKGFVFLGMIGSVRKARTVRDHFAAEGIATRAELDAVACPVGVRIRSRTVEEIAVSIVAQYIDKRAELVQGGG